MADQLPVPGDSYETIIAKLFPLGPQASAQWLQQNADTLDPALSQRLVDFFGSQQVQGGGSYLAPAQQAETSAGLRQAAEAAVSQALTNHVPTGSDLNKDGKTDKMEAAAVKAATDKLGASIADQGGTGADVTAAKNKVASNLGGTALVPIPQTVMQYTGGLPPTDAQVQSMMAAWNDLHPNQKVDSTDQLYRQLSLDGPDQKGAIESGLFGIDPVQSYTVRFADGSSHTMAADEYKAFTSQYGFQSKDLTALVRVANTTNMRNEDGSLMTPVLASLVRAHRDTGVDVKGKGAGARAGEAARDSHTVNVDVAGPLGATAPDAHKTRGGTYYTDSKGNPVPGRDSAGMLPLQHSAVTQLALKYQEGQYIYAGNDTLAYVHTFDPALASRLASGHGTAQDLDKYNGLLVKGNWDQNAFTAMGVYVSGLKDYGQNQDSGGGRGSGVIRSIPDQDALRQAAKDMYRQLFAAEPSDAELNSLVAGVNSAVSGAGAHQTVDPQAKLRAALEANPHYNELYGNKPGGMSEADYQGQFQGAARQLLGTSAPDPSAIQGGMRTGDVQTTLGQITAQKSSFNNSTFMARLASAAQVVQENT